MALVPDIGEAVKDMPTLVLGRALVTAPLVGLTNQLDIRLHGVDPWKVVAGTAGATLLLAYLYNLTQQRVYVNTSKVMINHKELRAGMCSTGGQHSLHCTVAL